MKSGKVSASGSGMPEKSAAAEFGRPKKLAASCNAFFNEPVLSSTLKCVESGVGLLKKST
jgi:hypothetical protein